MAVYRGNTLIESGIPTFDGLAVDGVKYLTRRAFEGLVPDKGMYYYVIEEAVPLLGTFAAGTAAGTKFTSSATPAGATLKYYLGVMPLPLYGEATPTGGTTYTSGADIATAAVGNTLTIVADIAGVVAAAAQKVLTAYDVHA
jgi:hypothetical protein